MGHATCIRPPSQLERVGMRVQQLRVPGNEYFKRKRLGIFNRSSRLVYVCAVHGTYQKAANDQATPHSRILFNAI
jgi:hypothetical protein